jgi:hypothetical protein
VGPPSSQGHRRWASHQARGRAQPGPHSRRRARPGRCVGRGARPGWSGPGPAADWARHPGAGAAGPWPSAAGPLASCHPGRRRGPGHRGGGGWRGPASQGCRRPGHWRHDGRRGWGPAADQDPGHGPVAGQPPAPRGRQRPGPASLPTHHFRPLPTRPSSHGLGRSLCHATAWLVGRHGAAWPRHRAKAGTSGLYRRPWPRRVTSGRTHPQTGVGPMGEPRARWVHGARGRAPSQARGKGPAGAPPCQLSAWAQLRPSCRASGWGPSATLPDDCLGPSSEHQARRLHRGPHEPRPTVPGNCMGAPNPHPPTQQANGPDPYRRWHPGQSVVPRPPRTTLRNGVAQRGQGRPAWP